MGANGAKPNTVGATFAGPKPFGDRRRRSRPIRNVPRQGTNQGPSGHDLGNHWANFIDALRSRKASDLHAPITEGAISTMLLHLANISYRLGRSLEFDEKTMTCKNDKEANAMFRRKYRAPFVVPQIV